MITTLLILYLSSFILLFYIKKKKILTNKTGDLHQTYTSKKEIPLFGGIFLYLFMLVSTQQENLIFFIFCFILLILGILSDMKKIISPQIRLFLQFLLIFSFVYLFNLEIQTIRIQVFDQLLDNVLFNILFTSFCILIIVNGSNFIDGVNTLTIGYFLIVIIALIKLDNSGLNIYSIININYFLYSLIFLFFLNLFNQIYLGDHGAYLLGFVSSVLLVNFYYYNQNVSPFFIVLLLWYPAFETLFSIIRKIKFKRTPIDPDIFHLHHLIFNFIKQKYQINKNSLCNSLTGCLINLYNFAIIFFSLRDINNSQYQIMLILFNILIYSFLYLRFFKKKFDHTS